MRASRNQRGVSLSLVSRKYRFIYIAVKGQMTSELQGFPTELLYPILLEAGQLQPGELCHAFAGLHAKKPLNQYNPHSKVLRRVCRRWKQLVDLPSSTQLRFTAASLRGGIPFLPMRAVEFNSRITESNSMLAIRLEYLNLDDILDEAGQHLWIAFTEAIYSLANHKGRIVYLEVHSLAQRGVAYFLNLIHDISKAGVLLQLEVNTPPYQRLSDHSFDDLPIREHVRRRVDGSNAFNPFLSLNCLQNLKIVSSSSLLAAFDIRAFTHSLSHLNLLSPRGWTWNTLHCFLSQFRLDHLQLDIKEDILVADRSFAAWELEFKTLTSLHLTADRNLVTRILKRFILPKIKILSIKTGRLCESVSSYIPCEVGPWFNNVERLAIHSASVDEPLSDIENVLFLLNNEALKQLDITFDRVGNTSKSSIDIVKLPYLEALTVTSDDLDLLERVLMTYSMPRLSEFRSVCAHRDLTDPRLRKWEKFLSKSRSTRFAFVKQFATPWPSSDRGRHALRVSRKVVTKSFLSSQAFPDLQQLTLICDGKLVGLQWKEVIDCIFARTRTAKPPFPNMQFLRLSCSDVAVPAVPELTAIESLKGTCKTYLPDILSARAALGCTTLLEVSLIYPLSDQEICLFDCQEYYERESQRAIKELISVVPRATHKARPESCVIA